MSTIIFLNNREVLLHDKTYQYCPLKTIIAKINLCLQHISKKEKKIIRFIIMITNFSTDEYAWENSNEIINPLPLNRIFYFILFFFHGIFINL